MRILCLVLAVALSLTSLSQALQHLTLQKKPKSSPLHLQDYLSRARQEQSLYHHHQALSQPQQSTTFAPHTLPISFQSSDFFVNLTLGTPGQPFSVLLNSVVSGLWVPSSLCPPESYDVCKNHHRYNSSASSTYEKEEGTVGLAGMTANISIDTVSLADLAVTGQTFAEVIQYAYNDSTPPPPYDGILGLSPSSDVFGGKGSSLLTNMKLQGLVDQAIFGVYLIRNTSSGQDAGGLVIGGRDPSQFRGSLVYVPSASKDAWEFEVKDIFLISSPGMDPLCHDGCKAIPNTGSHFVATNHRYLDTLHRYLGATVFAQDYTYHFNCSSLDKLQSVYFSIGNTLFYLPWQSYVNRAVGPGGEHVCLSSFVGLDDMAGYGWYLGEAFFASLYVEFDVDKQRMGFAPSKYSH